MKTATTDTTTKKRNRLTTFILVPDKGNKKSKAKVKKIVIAPRS